MVELEASRPEKRVDLLLFSAYAARLLGGARTTSCKSAKDRTSVFHTLEVTGGGDGVGGVPCALLCLTERQITSSVRWLKPEYGLGT